MKIFAALIFSLPLLLNANLGHANEVEIVDVVVKKSSENTFLFSVSLKHNDEGWDHYANEWQVIGPDGSVLGSRILAHPHVNEQPFTRSLSDVYIPRTIQQVTIRAQDSVHGWAKETLGTNVPH